MGKKKGRKKRFDRNIKKFAEKHGVTEEDVSRYIKELSVKHGIPKKVFRRIFAYGYESYFAKSTPKEAYQTYIGFFKKVEDSKKGPNCEGSVSGLILMVEAAANE